MKGSCFARTVACPKREGTMGSTFGGIEIGKRGLYAHQTALSTTGHNISNADNPNYARQRVTMQSMDPIYNPSLNRAQGPGQLGQGVQIHQIERIRDTFYDDQIIESVNANQQWKVSQEYLYQMEKIFNEPSDNTLRSLTDDFWSSWQELSAYPDDRSHREVVLERARALGTRVNDISSKLHNLRQRAENELVAVVDRVNSLGGEIRQLNEDILKLQVLGDNPNDLQDRRDLAMEELSKLVDVRVGRNDKDEMIVFIGEQALVQGEIQRKLKLEKDPKNEGFSRVAWEHNDRDLILKGGKMFGLLDIRDKAITERIDNTDTFAINVADAVNEIHRDGFGLDGSTDRDFFQIKNLSATPSGAYTIQNAAGNFDLNADGQAEVTGVFRVSGVNTVAPENRIGIEGTLTFHKNDSASEPVLIDYSPDDTVRDVIRRINDSDAGVVAYLNHDNQLGVKALTASDDRRSNFMIRHMEDSGEFLVGLTGVLNDSGIQGSFDFRRLDEISKFRSPAEGVTLTPLFHPASYMGLAEGVMRNPSSIAAGRGKDTTGSGDYDTAGGAANGENALLIAAALKQGTPMIGEQKNVEEFYNALISRLGTQARTAEDGVKRSDEDLATLNDLRQSVMGVNLDEEMANMVQYQQSYNASARLINTMNELLDQIIRLGA